MPIQSDNPPQILTISEWKGLNQQSKRGSIDDNEEWWDENLFAIGPGNLRACFGPSAPVYTAPAGTTILRLFCGFYGNNTAQYGAPPPGAMGWMFLSDGSIDEIQLFPPREFSPLRAATLAAGGAWTPIGPQYWASAKVWRPQFSAASIGQPGGVLFGSPKGLYAWDGTTLYKPGDTAPDWLTDAGSTGAPTVPMPSGLPGIYAMEVFQSRLWVAGKDVISFSAPSNGADFSTTDGGGSFGYFGDKLVYSYMDLHAVGGYMFVFGDSSTDLISQVTLSGSGTPESPFTTNFSYENVDPQVGQRFPRPVGVIGRYMVLFNMAGFFLMQGGDAQPIGDKVTGIWNTLNTSQYLPTFAVACMHGFRVLLVNGRFTDIFGVTRSMLLMWHPTRGHEFWSVASQGVELTNIATYEQDSCEYPFGTDGTNLYQLFAQPDPTLIKRLVTKTVRGQGMSMITTKNWKRVYLEVDDNDGRGVQVTGMVECGDGGVPGGTQGVSFELSPGERHKLIPQPIEGFGIYAGVDLISYSPDFTYERLHLAAEERTLYGA